MKRKNAFINAANGIGSCVRQEVNFRIQLIAALAAVSLGIFFKITTTEWLFIVGCCMLVLSLELLNTAIENICDMVTKDFNPIIKIAKDTAAAAVFVSAMGSAVMGAIIFLPKIIQQIKLFQ